MKGNLRPFGYLDEYIDMLDASAETKGEIGEKLIDNIQKNNKIQLEQERLEGYMEGEKWAKLEYKRETAEKEDYVRMYVMLYKAITNSNKDPEYILSGVIEYLEAEIGRGLEFYENERPKGLSYDPKDLELLRKISARIRKREEILRRFENE